MISFSLLDLLASFFVSILVLKYHFLNVLKYFSTISLVIFTCFIFNSKEDVNKDLLNEIIFVTATLLAKCAADMTLSIVAISIPALVSKGKVSIVLLLSSPISRFFFVSIPYVNYFFRHYLNLHPFLFISSLFLSLRILMEFLNIDIKFDKSEIESEQSSLSVVEMNELSSACSYNSNSDLLICLKDIKFEEHK